MSLLNSIGSIQNENGEITLMVLPLQFFESTTGNANQQNQNENNSLIVEQNLVLKKLEDGTFVINTGQCELGDIENLPLVTNITEAERIDDKGKENELENTDQESSFISSTNPRSLLKKSLKTSPLKPKVRYLNSKLSSIPKLGRPKKSTAAVSKGPYICKFCNSEFDKLIDFNRHEITHQNDKQYKCAHCQAAFNIVTNYYLHLATHNLKDLSCPECKFKFQRLASLKSHLRIHAKDESLYCQECNIYFENDAELNSHFQKHAIENPTEDSEMKNVEVNIVDDSLKCKVCSYEFTTKNELRKHLSEHTKIKNMLHVKRKKFRKSVDIKKVHTCPTCKKNFQKNSQLLRHIRIHSGEKPFVCKICERGFNQRNSLKAHMTLHTGAKPYECTLCKAKFSQKGNLRAHVLKTHSAQGNAVFACTECSCVFKRLGSLNGHMTKNHPETKTMESIKALNRLTEPSVIDSSNLQLNTGLPNLLNQNEEIPSLNQQNLNLPLETSQNIAKKEDNTQHLNSTEVDSSESVIQLATIAVAGTNAEGNVQLCRIKQRTVGHVKYHLCNYCTKEFRKPSDLIRHTRVHTREKPYKCKICDRSFAVKSTLNAHQKIHLLESEKSCKMCNKVFGTQKEYLEHVRKTHITHTCKVCMKSFRNSRLLKNHSLTHMSKEEIDKTINENLSLQEPIILTNKGIQTVETSLKKRPLKEAGSAHRPHKCTICGAGFRNYSHLKQHRLSHTVRRPFECTICKNRFQTNLGLKNHILNTHNRNKSHTCHICQKNFTVYGSLKRHLESHNLSNKSVICPYCFKNFKTIETCRKHIKLHHKNDNKEISAVNVGNELSFMTDLENALTDTSFNLNTIEGEQIENIGENLTESNVPQLLPTISPPKNLPQLNFINNLIGNKEIEITSSTLPSQQNLIDDNINNQMLNIIGNENYIDTSMYTSIQNVIPSTDELVNTLTGNNQEQEKSTEENNQLMFIHLPVDQMHNFENTDLILSQLKLQNESLFLNVIPNSSSEHGSNWIPFQVSTSNIDNQSEMLVLPPDVDQNETSLPQNLTNIENLNPNIKNLFISTNNDNNLILQNNSEEILESDIQPAIPEIVNSQVDNPEEGVSFNRINNNKVCKICRVNFPSEVQLKLHDCINFVSVDNLITNEEEGKIKGGSNEPVIVLKVVSNPAESEGSNVLVSEKSSDPLETEKPQHKHKCTYCPKSFKKHCDLVRHTRVHTGEKPFECSECKKTFALKSTLAVHIKIHTGKKEFNCPVCNSAFSTTSSRKLHMRTHTGAKPFKCIFCDLTFRTSGHRKAHLLVHYKESKKTGKLPSQVTTRHGKPKMTTIFENAVQGITEKQLETDITSNLDQFNIQNTEFDLENNIIITDPNVISSLNQLQIQAADQGTDLIENNIIITDYNPCITTTQREVNFDDLDQKTKQEIENLLRKDQEQKLAPKIFECLICKKGFKNKYFLDRHSKVHQDQKDFICEHCNKGFRQKAHLKSHMKIHSNLRPYSCSQCNNSFSHAGNLKTHIKRIHGKKEEILEGIDAESFIVGANFSDLNLSDINLYSS